MVVLRCTRKLLTRIGGPYRTDVPVSTTLLGDWYGNLVIARRVHFVVFLSERSRLPVLLPGRELRSLPDRFADAAACVLRGIGVGSSLIQSERAAMSEVMLASTDSRSMLASLNDFIINVKWLLQREPDWTLERIAIDLSEMPVGPLGYRTPRAATLDLLAAVRGSR